MEENQTQEIQEDIIKYKIMAGKKYRVFKSEYNGKVFYKIQMQQKNFDDTISTYYRPIMFKKDVELANETDIIIKKAFETLRENKNDKYNPISSLFIQDFITINEEEERQNLALENYRNNLIETETDQNLELPF